MKKIRIYVTTQKELSQVERSLYIPKDRFELRIVPPICDGCKYEQTTLLTPKAPPTPFDDLWDLDE